MVILSPLREVKFSQIWCFKENVIFYWDKELQNRQNIKRQQKALFRGDSILDLLHVR
jgi:hypothetical protein